MERLVLLDPYRPLRPLAAHHHLQRDIVGHLRLAAPVVAVETAAHGRSGFVPDGPSAAVVLAGGRAAGSRGGLSNVDLGVQPSASVPVGTDRPRRPAGYYGPAGAGRQQRRPGRDPRRPP